jgi:hypothetical protein
MKKGQLDFLMTYGWAILVVLVVIGALAYLGTGSSDKYIKNQLAEYDEKYNWNIIPFPINNYTIDGMQEYENNILVEIYNIRNSETKEYYFKCFNSIKTYRNFVDSIWEMEDITDDLRYKEILVNTEINAEEYEEARNTLEDIRKLLEDARYNLGRQGSYGIIDVDDEMENINVYLESLDELEIYIDLLEKRYWSSAYDQRAVYSKKLKEFWENTEDIEFFDEIVGWYDENIGVCLE